MQGGPPTEKHRPVHDTAFRWVLVPHRAVMSLPRSGGKRRCRQVQSCTWSHGTKLRSSSSRVRAFSSAANVLSRALGTVGPHEGNAGYCRC